MTVSREIITAIVGKFTGRQSIHLDEHDVEFVIGAYLEIVSRQKAQADDLIAHVDYGPDTAEETEIKRALGVLQREYQQLAEPYIKLLADIHATKLPRYFLVRASANPLVTP